MVFEEFTHLNAFLSKNTIRGAQSAKSQELGVGDTFSAFERVVGVPAQHGVLISGMSYSLLTPSILEYE